MIDSNDGVFSYVFGHAKANHHPHYWAYFASLHSTQELQKIQNCVQKAQQQQAAKCSFLNHLYNAIAMHYMRARS